MTAGIRMSSVHEHYDSHLAPIYLWMVGGFDNAVALGKSDLDALGIKPDTHKVALDLGAGFGMHAIPLAREGCSVTAIDNSSLLLDELRARGAGLPIHAMEGDLLNASRYVSEAPQLVLCMGDTLTHIQSKGEVEGLFSEVSRLLAPKGLFAMTFRDYTSPAAGDRRFIPVRSDDSRIHTCFLEEEPTHMVVHDIVHERTGDAWLMKVSAYRKLRLSPDWVSSALREVGLSPTISAGPRGMVQIVARAA
ncbi:class I SAM-dependent methyltransferase [Dyella caseinilytica]|nr:class I SAM-dependent methyltransferase [Dyella caseinilytica]